MHRDPAVLLLLFAGLITHSYADFNLIQETCPVDTPVCARLKFINYCYHFENICQMVEANIKQDLYPDNGYAVTSDDNCADVPLNTLRRCTGSLSIHDNTLYNSIKRS